jgi:hypothetical protein
VCYKNFGCCLDVDLKFFVCYLAPISLTPRSPHFAMSPEEFETKTFDYIICGGGTAGLVIAARLSEDPNVTVGVVEAGGNRLGDALIDAPNLFTQLWGKPEYDWDYQTVPQV